MHSTHRARLAALLIAAIALVPAGTAHAKKAPKPAPTPAPAPTAPAAAGPLDVTRLEIDVTPTAADPDRVGGIADISVPKTVRAQELTIAIRPAGKTWDRVLSFGRVGPMTLETWQPVQLSSSRNLPAGRYEAHVAVKIDGTWVNDELVTEFAVS
jgi:hypothetical protein